MKPSTVTSTMDAEERLLRVHSGVKGASFLHDTAKNQRYLRVTVQCACGKNPRLKSGVTKTRESDEDLVADIAAQLREKHGACRKRARVDGAEIMQRCSRLM